jgi:hypothetical protein
VTPQNESLPWATVINLPDNTNSLSGQVKIGAMYLAGLESMAALQMTGWEFMKQGY